MRFAEATLRTPKHVVTILWEHGRTMAAYEAIERYYNLGVLNNAEAMELFFRVKSAATELGLSKLVDDILDLKAIP